MRPGSPILAGTSPSPPPQTPDYGAAFYDQFKVHYLRPLDGTEMRDLLLRTRRPHPHGPPSHGGEERYSPDRYLWSRAVAASLSESETAYREAIARDSKDASPWNDLGNPNQEFPDTTRLHEALFAAYQNIAPEIRTIAKVFYDRIERLLKKLPEKTRRRPLEKLRSSRRRQSSRS